MSKPRSRRNSRAGSASALRQLLGVERGGLAVRLEQPLPLAAVLVGRRAAALDVAQLDAGAGGQPLDGVG